MKRILIFTAIAAAAVVIYACGSEKQQNGENAVQENKPAAAAQQPGSTAGISGKSMLQNDEIIKAEPLKISQAANGRKMVSNGLFSYLMPSSWRANTNAAEDEEYKVYEAKMFPSSSSKKMASYIYVSYFDENNEDIATWQEFVRVNSQNILRRGKTAEWEKYEPVKESAVAGRKAYIVARNCRHFLNPNSKDDSYVMKKEKMYVLPASKGYYVIRYASDEKSYNENINAFEAIAASFKGKY